MQSRSDWPVAAPRLCRIRHVARFSAGAATAIDAARHDSTGATVVVVRSRTIDRYDDVYAAQSCSVYGRGPNRPPVVTQF